MATNAPLRSERFATFLLLNLLAAAVAPWFFTIFGAPWDQLITFGIAYVALGLVDRNYLRAIFWGAIFFVYLVWQIILSNIQIAWLIIQPKLKLDPGIVGVPLILSSGLEITILASAITLTPGTISVELEQDEDGNNVLFVHNLTVHDPVAYRESVHQGFERMILRITRGS